MIILKLWSDGVITDVIAIRGDSLDVTPIQRTDWSIDSIEALNIMLNERDIELLISGSETQYSLLTLERTLRTPGDAVTWCLSILGVPGSGYPRHEYIDAIIGELVPTRIF
jgi:hypothetical protein